MNYKKYFDKAYTYAEYRRLTKELLEKNKTTGENQSEAYVEYTRLNQTRMERLDKTTKLFEDSLKTLSELDSKINWLVITEPWCGDAAQIVPVLNKLAEASGLISFRCILRDENPELMDAHLTNGGKSIPKLILLDENYDLIGQWGPRPKEIQEMVMENKRTQELDYSEFSKKVQLWYAKDKTESIQNEVNSLIVQKTISS